MYQINKDSPENGKPASIIASFSGPKYEYGMLSVAASRPEYLNEFNVQQSH